MACVSPVCPCRQVANHTRRERRDRDTKREKEGEGGGVSRERGLESAHDVNHVGMVCGHGQRLDLAVDKLVL